MYIDLTGPTVTAIPVKYDPHKKIVPLLAALYHTWVLIKRYFQISRYLRRSSSTLVNGEGGEGEEGRDRGGLGEGGGGDITGSELMDPLLSTSLRHKGSSAMEQIFSVLRLYCAYLSQIMIYYKFAQFFKKVSR